MNDELKFDFDFEDQDSAQLLLQAKQEILGFKDLLGTGEKDAADEEIQKAEEYFAALQSGKLEFTRAEPTVFPLNLGYFEKNDMPVPKNFPDLSAQGRFYWMEMPLFLVPGKNPFYKLQFSMEFGEDVSGGKTIPRVHSAFPASKFAEYATIKGEFNFGLGEDLTFTSAAGIDNVALPTNIPIVKASADGKLSVNAKLASKFGFIAGPYSHTFKSALVDCRFAGERVLWTITDKQSLKENNPIFIVILMVSKEVVDVRVKAYAQAHRSAPLPQFMVRLLGKISSKSAEWLKKGSPITLAPYSHLISTRDIE